MAETHPSRNTANPAPTIELLFAGLQILFIDRNPDPNARRPFCEVGLLRNTPGHELRVEVLELLPQNRRRRLARYNRKNLERYFWLDVFAAVGEGIRFVEDPGAPQVPGSHPFNRVVDFGDPTIAYEDPFQINHNGFASTFHLNNGLFFTKHLSVDNLRKRKGGIPSSHPPRQVAIAVGAHINLNEGSRAVFTQGEKEIVFDHNKRYRINVVLEHDDDDDHFNDADLYYPTIGFNLPPSKRIHFEGDRADLRQEEKRLFELEGARVPPHAICFTGSTSNR